MGKSPIRRNQRWLAACFSISVAAICAPNTTAHAATDEAWAEFRQAVETACLEAATGNLDAATATATVDPFGSESFGLALLQGRAKGGDQTVMMICVYDKKTRQVELGGEIDAPR